MNEIVSLARRFVGTWNLISWQLHYADGRTVKPFGGRFVGRVLYDASGHMSAQIMRLDRPLFESGSRRSGTAREFRSAFEGYVAFFGTYSVNAKARTVTHLIEGHLSPNKVGSRRVRSFEFEGGRLTLRPKPEVYDGVEVQAVLVWERLNRSRNPRRRRHPIESDGRSHPSKSVRRV